MNIHFKKSAISSAILLALATPQAAVAVEGDALDAGAPIVLSQYSNGNTFNYAANKGITQDANGNFIAVWVDKVNYVSKDIIARRFNADGTPVANEFVVNSTTTGNQLAPKVAASPGGAFVVVFVDQTDNFIHARLYGADGVALGNQFQVNTTSGYSCGSPTVAMAADGSFIVAWQIQYSGTDRDVLYRRYAADGTALDAADVTANTITSGYQQNPAVAMNPAGNFIISWDDDASGDTDIQARRYSADGTALDTPEVVVNETLGGNQSGPSVAMDADGDYVVAWTNGLIGVSFRRFDADGNALSGETAVVLNADYVPQAPHLSADFYGSTVGMSADGRFVITVSERNGADGNSYGTFMQRYSSSGTPAGGLAVVGDWSASIQNDGVHMDADGDIVVVYEHYSELGEIEAERYEGAGHSVDLSLSGSRDTDTVGGAVTYTFTTTNNGSGYALAVSLEDVLPGGVTYTGFTDGLGDGWVCSDNSGTVTCTLPSLAPGAQSSVDITVDTTGLSGTLDNTATVTNAVTDSNTGNNSDTVSLGSNAAPVISGTPAISGTAIVGSPLSAGGFSVSDSDGDVVTLTYQWKAGGVDIVGATSSSYTLTAAEAHTDITVTVTASDNFGGSDNVTTAAVSVSNTAPTFTGTPAISGTGEVGNTLSVTDTAINDLDGDSVTLSYQWQLDGSNIGGATADSYTVQEGDAGGDITVTVTADDANGGNTSVTTAAVSIASSSADSSSGGGGGAFGWWGLLFGLLPLWRRRS